MHGVPLYVDIKLIIFGCSGYMSPEYAMEGNFSEKSDVYSFGVLLLEIVSGRKNSGGFQYNDRPLNLVGYVSSSSLTTLFLLNSSC